MKLLTAIFALLLLLGTGIALAAQDEGPGAQPDLSALSAPSADSAGVEIKADRTATSTTFQLPDGSRETRIFENSVNYRAPDGKWKPIGNKFEEAEGESLSNGANSFDVTLPGHMGAAPVRFTVGDQWISSRLLGQTTDAAELEKDGTASYEAASAGTNFNFSGLANGLKEDIEIATPSAPSTYRFELSSSAGVTPAVAKDGAIEFRDQADHLVAELPAAVMFDSSGGLGGVSEAVEYQLEPNDSGAWRLTVEASKEWLSQPDRVWPVTIDPSIVAPESGDDCILYNAALENNNLCANSGWPQLVGVAWYRASGVDQIGRSTLQFDLGAVPAGADITSATAKIYSPSKVANSSGVQLRRILSPWNSTATWHCAWIPSSCIPWTTPGGDYNEEGSEVLTSKRGTEPGWWEFEGLEPVVQGWITESKLRAGLLLKLKDETQRECCLERTIEFASSAFSNPSLRPVLAVTYIPKAPTTSVLTSPVEGQRTARRLKLKSAWQAPGVSGISFQYREGKIGTFKTIPTELVRNAKGETVSWPVTITEGAKESPPLYFDAARASGVLRGKGGSVQVRAVYVGTEGAGGSSGYSAAVEAQVNPLLGGPTDAMASVGPGSVDLLTGNLSVGAQDVNIAAFNSALEFTRSFNSREAGKLGDTGVLGQGWKPGVPVEAAGGSDWRSAKSVNFFETIEGETETFSYVLLTDLEGGEISFEYDGAGGYITPPEMTGWKLTAENAGTRLVLAEPGGNSTAFENLGGGAEYIPVSVTQAGGAGNKTQMVYEFPAGGQKRLKEVIAPTAPGVTCNSGNSRTTTGCRVMAFTYVSASNPAWGAPASYGDRLSEVNYYAPGFGGPWMVAAYNYNSEGRLVEEYDPRIAPRLATKYSYYPGGQLKTITPPGLEPWTLEYGKTFEAGATGKTVEEEEEDGRLLAVKRASLLSSPTTAQTTIAYGVPVNGPPYELGGASVGKWGQTDIPDDAAAVFPPDQVPTASPPTSYSHATLYYMDAEGRTVNTATPAGAGTTEASISTSEYDEFGNVVRELTPGNRLRAIKAGSESVTVANQLATKRIYGEKGTQLEEEFGPLHTVRIQESGASKEARLHRTIEYDAGWPGTGLKPHLPTRETTGARIVGVGTDADQRVTETNYNWVLRQPIETIVDPGSGHLAITQKTVYDESTGLPIETRQPSNVSGGGAGTTKTFYYSAGPGGGGHAGCNLAKYAGLPCFVEPAAQPGTSGQPQLLVRKFASYNALGEPTEVTESPGGGAENVRKSIATFDAAGRSVIAKIEGGGVEVPRTETVYSASTGLPIVQRIENELEVACPTEEPCEIDRQATTRTYDALGRVKEYEDADGNKATTTYDLDGRPVTISDGKGSQTMTYDPTSGLPTKLEDSAAGTFTASYDADGNLAERTLPDGLTANTTYNEAGNATHLTYTKAASCGTSCTWYDEGIERSIYGQDLAQTGTLASEVYGYDKAGRLTSAAETPTGGSCTTRSYSYDVDSNRKSLTTRAPVAGACSFSGGTPQEYKYDAADRLLGTGLTYDAFGRITSLPAEFAGGKTLTTKYFSTDMVASQTQNGVTNTYELDASLRQRQRIQGNGLEGTEIFHYDGPGDSPAWTERGSAWSRNVVGIGGELAAIQESGSGTTLQLTNLHGDIVATASPSSSETKLLGTFRFDEFGNPISGSAVRYGWLGGKRRRTELLSGVIQMGARSYVPEIGRFISTDPVPGGSANAYDYANADPLNNYDIEGTRSHRDGKFGHLHVTYKVTSCTKGVGCEGQFSFIGVITEHRNQKSTLHMWITVDNPSWPHSAVYQDHPPVYNHFRTPSYSTPIFIPFGTVYTFHLFVKVGKHTETLEAAYTSAEGEVCCV